MLHLKCVEVGMMEGEERRVCMKWKDKRGWIHGNGLRVKEKLRAVWTEADRETCAKGGY